MNFFVNHLLSWLLGVAVNSGKNDVSAFVGVWSDIERMAFANTQKVFQNVVLQG